jgi:hypothetical protein
LGLKTKSWPQARRKSTAIADAGHEWNRAVAAPTRRMSTKPATAAGRRSETGSYPRSATNPSTV